VASGIRIELARSQAMATSRRRSVNESKPSRFKTTISLDTKLYALLCYQAAEEHTGISALTSRFIQEGLKGLVVSRRGQGESVDPVDLIDRSRRADSVSLTAAPAVA
jgi:hypothetical protein